MIYRGRTGRGISALIAYVNGQGRDENRKRKTLAPGETSRARLLGGMGFGFNPQTKKQEEIARRLMEYHALPFMQASNTKHCANDAMHVSLSWAHGQKPDDAEMMRATRFFMKKLGMEDAMAMVYRHTDRDHDHAHLVIERVNPNTGLAIDDYQHRYKGMAAALDWEIENNQITPRRQWQHALGNLTRSKVDHPGLRDKLLTNEATISIKTLNLAIALGGNFGARLEAERERFIADNNMLRLKRYREGQTAALTTADIWHEESRTLASARRLSEMTGWAVPEPILAKYEKKYKLTDEQSRGFRHLLGDSGLTMLSGEAGTGKSRVFDAARDALKESGKDPQGRAFTNKVSQNMRRSGFASASTIAAETWRMRYGNSKFDDKTALMIDEASQLDTPQHFHEMLREAAKRGTKVVMTGDRRQLGSIDRGGMWAVMEKRFGSENLTEIMRNKKEPDAFHAMHKRDFGKALKVFRKSDSIHWVPSRDDAIKAIAEQYERDYLEDPEAARMIMALTNEDVDKLNEHVQRLRNRHAKTPARTVTVDTVRGPRQFSIGDRIALRQSSADKKDKDKGLINGAFGYLLDVETRADGKQTMTMRLDRPKDQQQRVFKFPVGRDADSGDIADVRLGWASTVYNAQGDTLKQGYVMYDPRAKADTSYVGMSRHSDQLRFYANTSESDDDVYLADQLKRGEDKTAAHAYMLDPRDRPKLQQQPPSPPAPPSATPSPPLQPENKPMTEDSETGIRATVKRAIETAAANLRNPKRANDVKGLFRAHHDQQDEFDDMLNHAIEQHEKRQQEKKPDEPVVAKKQDRARKQSEDKPKPIDWGESVDLPDKSLEQLHYFDAVAKEQETRRSRNDIKPDDNKKPWRDLTPQETEHDVQRRLIRDSTEPKVEKEKQRDDAPMTPDIEPMHDEVKAWLLKYSKQQDSRRLQRDIDRDDEHAERKLIDRDHQHAERELTDRTDATMPGLLPPSDDDRERHRTRTIKKTRGRGR